MCVCVCVCVSQVDERKARLDRSKKKLAQAEKELERSYTHMGDLEASAKQMEEIFAEEEARMRACDKEQTGEPARVEARGCPRRTPYLTPPLPPHP